MNRSHITVLLGVGLLGVLAPAAAFAGNAFAGPSSQVGPIGQVYHPVVPKRVMRPAMAATPKPRPTPAAAGAVVPAPAVSPYLNLFRTDASRVFNYYTLVRPQITQIQIDKQRAAQLQQLEQRAMSEPAPTPLGQGHHGRFMTHGEYFRKP